MKFTLTQADLDKAVRAYIRGLMTISEDTMITVDVRSSKGETITEVNLYSPDELAIKVLVSVPLLICKFKLGRFKLFCI